MQGLGAARLEKKGTAMAREIFVTLSDIANGVKGNGCMCPVAQACRREGLTGAEVDGEYIVWETPFGQAELYAPHAVQQFVRDFDAGNPVIPFKFRLEEARLELTAA